MDWFSGRLELYEDYEGYHMIQHYDGVSLKEAQTIVDEWKGKHAYALYRPYNCSMFPAPSYNPE